LDFIRLLSRAWILLDYTFFWILEYVFLKIISMFLNSKFRILKIVKYIYYIIRAVFEYYEFYNIEMNYINYILLYF